MIPGWIARLAPASVVQHDAEITLCLASENLLKATGAVRAHGWFIEDITATDLSEEIMLLYHFAHFDEPGRITLRLTADHEAPSAPSIASIYSGAAWHERECRDLFGITFVSHPNPLPLLLSENAGNPPLVKDEAARKPISELMPFFSGICGGGTSDPPGEERES